MINGKERSFLISFCHDVHNKGYQVIGQRKLNSCQFGADIWWNFFGVLQIDLSSFVWTYPWQFIG